MRKSIFLSLFTVFCFFSLSTYAQTFVQTIRGQVIDRVSREPLPGANVSIPSTNPLLGTTTDESGYYTLANVPQGRISVSITFVGYQAMNFSNLQLNSGKELIVNAELEELLMKTEEITITAQALKTKPLNEMTTLSARTFTIEESQRFAGARNDVSRMATNFAGVSTANDAVNDIVIRGNSPNGLLWRLDGIEIGNPNHFGFLGATGGPVSMLNNNVLANSDFITAAFPAEYGNAISGVFDLRMRNGNDQKHEFLGQIGFNGFELGAEGPLFGIKRASYLVNYRYSTLGVMSAMGMDFGTGTAIPYYQDLSFKINIPTGNNNAFSVFGLVGKNNIEFIRSKVDSAERSEGLYADDNLDVYAKNALAIVGMNQTIHLKGNSFVKISLAANYSNNNSLVDSILGYSEQTVPYYRSNFENLNLISALTFNKKVNASHNIRIGIENQYLSSNLNDSIVQFETQIFKKVTDENGSTNLRKAYAQYQWKPVDFLVINAGVNLQNLELNGRTSVEPRFGVKINVSQKQSLSLGYGLHSKIQPIYSYFQLSEISPNAYEETNKNMDFTKAHHFVVAYDYNISANWRIKSELYYQTLYNVPIEEKATNFSLLNHSSFSGNIPDSLVNEGTGRNYGAELTVEKFLDRGFYVLFTTSVFDSKYKTKTGTFRSTAFDGKYVLNFLAGKEFKLKSRKADPKYSKWLSFDGRITAAGGQRYTPIDRVASQQNKQTEYDDSQAFTKQFSDYFRADIRMGFRLDGKRVSQEWVFDIQNVTNHENPLYLKYNVANDTEVTINQLKIFPVMQYRVIF